MKKILLIEGDGIGPEVVSQTKKIIDFFTKNTDKKFETESALLGGIAFDESSQSWLNAKNEELSKKLFNELNQIIILK